MLRHYCQPRFEGVHLKEEHSNSGSSRVPDMEASSLGHGKFCISASLSVSSLDETLATRANLLQSLLSESVTLDSLSSKSDDTLPSFPLCKLPNFSLIGLGDRLKLFSATLLPSKEGSTKSRAKPIPVTIGAPTSPRLKNMLKECLSINKWAETSAGWQAPGHVPWESIQEGGAQYWIPEGSYFSPEYFSLALQKARKRFESTQPFSLSRATSSPSRNSISIAEEGSQDTPSTDFYDMILELDTVKSFFQDTPQDFTFLKNSTSIQSAGKLSVPSLVVSNSHFTFQIPLESSFTLARSRSDTLARRRGKPTPPPLVVGKQIPAFDIPYPNVPTAFLGQLSEASLPVECAESDTKQTLHFEEMIKNLRLQCSTMELHNLPQDTSWNSRTPIAPTALGHGDLIGDKPKEIVSKDLPLTDTDTVGKPEFSAALQLQKPAPPEDDQNSAARRPEAVLLHSEQPSRSPVKSTLSRPLRSAMAKALMLPTKPVPKSVRFALTRHDLEKEISLSRMNTVIKSTPQPPVLLAEHQTLSDQNTPGVTDFPLSADRKSLQRSRSCTQQPSWKSISQTKKAPRTQVRSHSLIIGSMSPKVKNFTESEDNDNSVELFSRNMSSSGRSTQSLGRHSLSRIIKGPIFSGRDIKRATFSLGAHEFDENAIRRDSESPSLSHSLQKKSRMPIPLRNILTRFK